MTVRNLFVGACGSTALLAMMPSLASAAVQFDDVTISVTSSGTAGASSTSANPSKTYNSLSRVEGGVSQDAKSKTSGTGAKVDAEDTGSASFASKTDGTLSITQSVSASSSKTEDASGTAGDGSVSYDFTLTGAKDYNVNLDDAALSNPNEVVTFAETGGPTLWTSTAGTNFAKELSNLVAGGQEYTLTIADSSPLSTGTISGKGNSYTGTPSYLGTVDFDISAVPEPAAWAMMLLGLGGIGAVMRRRRRLEAGVVAA